MLMFYFHIRFSSQYNCDNFDQSQYAVPFKMTDYCFSFSLSDPHGKELAAYKAVTGILIFLILSVILLHFSRPTFKAIRKRCESLMKHAFFQFYS